MQVKRDWDDGEAEDERLVNRIHDEPTILAYSGGKGKAEEASAAAHVSRTLRRKENVHESGVSTAFEEGSKEGLCRATPTCCVVGLLLFSLLASLAVWLDPSLSDSLPSSKLGGTDLAPQEDAIGNTTIQVVAANDSSLAAEGLPTNAITFIEDGNDGDDDKGFWRNVTCLGDDADVRIVIKYNQSWCLDTQGIWRYSKDAKSSHFRRRTSEGIARCLANKHILFIGDSRTRYQYLSLANVLAHRVFPRAKESISNRSRSNRFHGLMRKTSDLNKFFRLSNRLLRTDSSEEMCNCYFVDPGTNEMMTSPGAAKVTNTNNGGAAAHEPRENRFFTAQTEYGKVHLTYIISHLDSCRLDLGYPPFNLADPFCEVGNCATSAIEQEVSFNNVSGCLRNLTREFERRIGTPITHAFVTTGWGHKDIGCAVVENAVESFVQSWVMTPPVHLVPKSMLIETPSSQSCDVPIFDRWNVTDVGMRDLYFDNVHPWSSANEEFNHMLLDLVCGDQ